MSSTVGLEVSTRLAVAPLELFLSVMPEMVTLKEIRPGLAGGADEVRVTLTAAAPPPPQLEVQPPPPPVSPKPLQAARQKEASKSVNRKGLLRVIVHPTAD